MSEYTANAGHDTIPEICFGDMQANEMGIEIPPQYAGRKKPNGKEYILIPLERNVKSEKTKLTPMRKAMKENARKRDLGESQDMIH